MYLLVEAEPEDAVGPLYAHLGGYPLDLLLRAVAS
jgi:hypothetical protein